MTDPVDAAHPSHELVDEARGTDARRSGEEHPAQSPIGDASDRLRQLGQLPLPAHERHGPKDTRRLVDTFPVTDAAVVRPDTNVHPSNTLNELGGDEWLYFTKSLWSTAYPSELGHATRRAHGANKPPRLMARLIEFFTRRGELVLDPFAGVGGTLLGAAMCRAPRDALGFEIEPRWGMVYDEVVREAQADRGGLGPYLADLGDADPGGPRTFDPSGCSLVIGDALQRLPAIESGSVDFVATDPPYNPQLRITMSGGALAERFANRRTDYAMVTDHPGDLANSATYGEFLDRMQMVFVELRRVLRTGRYAAVIVRDAYQDGRYRFTGSDLAMRADASGLIPKGDLVWYQAGTRLRPYGYPRAFVPNIVHQHILVFRAE